MRGEEFGTIRLSNRCCPTIVGGKWQQGGGRILRRHSSSVVCEVGYRGVTVWERGVIRL